MNMYSIRAGYWSSNKVEVKKLQVLKETDKTITVSYGQTSHRVLKKSLPLYWSYGDHLITNDLKGGISAWNTKVSNKIIACRNSIQQLEGQFIAEDIEVK